jgi:hypothetical protein
MLLGQVFERFIKESPVSVMVRGLLEKALCPQILDELFERSAKTQYTRELLFSTVVNLMSLVVCGIHPSVHAAHQASVEKIGVSVTSVYNKINGIEPSTSGELVREVAGQMEATIRHLNATMPDLLPGYRVKIIDGNAIAASEHRLKELRQINSAPLPGQSLVVLDLCIALVAYNVLSVVKAALRSVHGTDKIETEVSNYYLADEIRGTYRGMMIAIPPEEWGIFHNITFMELSQILKHLAGLAKLRAFRRHPRGPKIAQPKRTYLKNKPHVSTAKILAQKAQNINTP